MSHNKNKKGLRASPLSSLLFDTHCHPQDDNRHLDLIPRLSVAGLCLIGVRDIDWSGPPHVCNFL
jgi:hypothetical protein